MKKKAKPPARKRAPTNTEWYNKKYSVGEMASKAFTTAKYIATLVNVETLVKDTGNIVIANTQFTNAGVVSYLSGIAQGDDYNGRTGNSVKMSYLSILANFVIGASASNGTGIRIIVFRDRENRQALPAVTDVLESADVRSMYNHNTLERFTILKDDFRTIDLFHPNWTFTFDKRDKTHLYFAGTTSGIASADENSIFMLCLSETASGSTSPNGVINARIGYHDN